MCRPMSNMKILLLLFVTHLISAGNAQQHRFGYSRAEQLNWQKSNSDCGSVLQSPIEIDSRKAIPLKMPALEMIRYHDLLPGPLILHNNGHSVSLSIPKVEDANAKYVPYVFGAKLTNEYVLEGLHFHWGDKNNEGSEHIMNDVRYPMEMHIIHRNRKYPTAREAMLEKDGLAVLGFFFQLREKENRELGQLLKYLPQVIEFDTKVLINETFTLGSLISTFDSLERFYTYRGSLTTPPCSEAVTWILFPDPLPISLPQMAKFRHLQTHDAHHLFDNYREVQKLGPRRIFVRKLRPRGFRYNPNMNYTEWDWLQPSQPSLP